MRMLALGILLALLTSCVSSQPARTPLTANNIYEEIERQGLIND